MLNELTNNPLNIALFILLNVLIGNRIIVKLLKIDINKNELKLFIIQGIIISLTKILIPYNYYKIINLIVDLILYKQFFKITSEKLFLAELINLIIATISDNVMIVSTNIIIIEILELIIKTITYLIIKFNKVELDIKESLNEKEKMKIGLISLFSMFIISLAETKIINLSIYIGLLINSIFIAYLLIVIKCILLILCKEDAKKEIENLEGSNKRLQENYDDVRAFKHDFNNIMQGIGGYIVANDIKGLEKMYKSIYKECQQINFKQSINNEIINNPAILNLINNKIELAEKSGVELRVEVYVDLNSLNVSTYDLCRMLGILLDNAIEASCGCDDKIITIKFLKDKFNNRNLIVIENPYKNYLIDVKKIYEKGFSSKKNKISHGLGLWKIKQILKKNKNLQIYTSRDRLFKQQLEIY